VSSWGDITAGGASPTGLTNVVAVYPVHSAFAALLNDGTIRSWGHLARGGTTPTVLMKMNEATANVEVFSTSGAFAALRSDGTLHCFGASGETTPTGLTNVADVFSNDSAFVALFNDGTVMLGVMNLMAGWPPPDWQMSSVCTLPVGLSPHYEVMAQCKHGVL